MENAACVLKALRRRVAILVLFGIAFGYVEAAAVVYIRLLYEPIHQRLFPDRARDDLFPLFSVEQWAHEAPAEAQNVALEVGRELGTILMVALVALAVARDGRQWFAAFALTFGVWDVAYYLWLRLLIGWPRSVWDWDLVFAAPVPWVSPVLAPLAVAVVMTLTGLAFFHTEAYGRPLRPRRGDWAAVLFGALLILGAFWWDFRNTLAGGPPSAFNWPLLVLGLAVGLAGFGRAWSKRGPVQECSARKPVGKNRAEHS